jgi:hypothetical protein
MHGLCLSLKYNLIANTYINIKKDHIKNKNIKIIINKISKSLKLIFNSI